MAQLIYYQLEVAACLLLCYLFYRVALQGENHFGANRAYLLASLVVSLGIPLLHVPMLVATPNVSAWAGPSVFMLPNVAVAAEAEEGFQMPWQTLFWVAYGGGALVFLVRLASQIGRIQQFINRNRSSITRWMGCRLINTNGKMPTSTWFRYIFWDNAEALSEEDRTHILQHERAHARGLHSLDVVLAELMGAMLWYNPLIWLYKRALTDTHEYIADAAAQDPNNPTAYRSLLVKQLFRRLNLILTSPFKKHQVMKRVDMMRLVRYRSSRARFAFVLPLYGVLFILFSCERQPLEDLMAELPQQRTTTTTVSNPTEQDELLASMLSFKVDLYELPGAKPGRISMINDHEVEAELNGILIHISRIDTHEEHQKAFRLIKRLQTDEAALNQLLGKPTPATPVQQRLATATPRPPQPKVTNLETTPVPQRLSPKTQRLATSVPSLEVTPNTNTEEPVYQVVENQPVPPGGYADFYTAMAQELKYPKQAARLGIATKVYVGFIITKEGRLTDAEVLKGDVEVLNKEALRVVNAVAPLGWAPGYLNGEAVNVRIVLPITFELLH